MADGIGKSAMAATYQVDINGIARTERELAALDGAIRALRSGSYSSGVSATVASGLGTKDLFVSKFEPLKGRVQTVAQKAMIEGMDLGRDTQAKVLRAATTPTGLARKTGNGPGRDDTGAMIGAIQRTVEVGKSTSDTTITGFHGWNTSGRGYFPFQEKGTRTIQAANSLGSSIPTVREFLKRALGAIKR